jgi:SAM-dependent methyltransferase
MPEDLATADTAALFAELRRRTETDPAAMRAVASLGAIVEPGPLGLHDAMLGGWYNPETHELAPGFPVGADDTVLDVGCGDGGALNFCATEGAALILADIDPATLDRARTWLASSSARILGAHVTDANPLPLPDASASRVVCTEVLEHVDDPAAVLGELVRVARPGALFLLTVPDPVQQGLQQHLAPASYFRKPNHIHIFEREAFATLVQSAGLAIERRYTKGFYWAVWWLLFWQCNVALEDASRHPILNNWARTWASVLGTEDGLKTKQLLDRFLPDSQVIIARKIS